jgi:hypothetical protein
MWLNLLRNTPRNTILNSEGFNFGRFDRYSFSYDAMRGREQQLIDKFGGARSSGGTSRNQINGISPNNPFRDSYIEQATREFGIP